MKKKTNKTGIEKEERRKGRKEEKNIDGEITKEVEFRFKRSSFIPYELLSKRWS